MYVSSLNISQPSGAPTAVPMAGTPLLAKEPERAVMIMYDTNMIEVEMRKSLRRPRRSTNKAAPTAMIRFQRLRNPFSRVCWVTEVMPIVFRMRLR
jgi:hypothetical protein